MVLRIPDLPAPLDLPPVALRPILLVEDDSLIRSALVECFEADGFLVVEAADAEEAADLLGSGLFPPVLVTDINLGPGHDGLALADEMHRVWPAVPVVFITGRIDMLRSRGLKAGEHMVPKPFPLSTLLTLVRRLAFQEGGAAAQTAADRSYFAAF